MKSKLTRREALKTLSTATLGAALARPLLAQKLELLSTAPEPLQAPGNLADLRAMAGKEGLKYAEIILEWGFQQGDKKRAFDGSIKSTYDTGRLGEARPLPGDQRTVMTGPLSWKSPAGGKGRRGIVVPVFYNPSVRGSKRTILTVRTTAGSFSFQPVDLSTGPMLVSELGFFIRDQEKRMEPPAVPPILPEEELLKDKLSYGPDRGWGAIIDLYGPNVQLPVEYGPVRGWGNKGTPRIYVNPANEPITLTLKNPPNSKFVLPPRTVMVEPEATRDIAIGWRSPFTGKVNLRAKFVRGFPAFRDGYSWTVVHQNLKARTILAQGAVFRDESLTIPAEVDAGKLTGVAVENGDGVALVIGPVATINRDTMFVELTITEAGGAGRTWDLTRDVMNDIEASNPHADSLGNVAVWHFLAPGGWVPQVAKMTLPFESKATTADEFLDELARHKPNTLRQRVRALPEQTWQGAMEAIHGKREWPPFPKAPYEPNMQVEVPDPHLTGIWKIGAWQLLKSAGPDKDGKYVIKDYPYTALALECDRILWALDQTGMHKAAADGMNQWLESQHPDGMLLMDLQSDRNHATGALAIPWVMVAHYWLTGDQEWLKVEAPHLKAAAQWIVKRRGNSLQPRISCGDGDPTGRTQWIWADTFAYQSVVRVAALLAEIDPQGSAELAAEAEKYRADLRKVFDESLALNPVIRTWDGTCRSFLAAVHGERGPRSQALPENEHLLSHWGGYCADIVITSAALEACLRSGLFAANDLQVDGTLNVLEDVYLRSNPWHLMRKGDYDPERDWFNFGWGYQSGWERLPDCYLFMDDIPNFLRAWLNRCATDLNLTNWTFDEHYMLQNDKVHNNAIFLSLFRNMLVMEIGDTLWLARATPRAWLKQGKKISVRNSPTYFGTVAYEIVSDVDNGKISATVELPSRKVPAAVQLRFRHPRSAPIKSVKVNGKKWRAFDKDKETIELKGLTGTMSVTARY